MVAVERLEALFITSLAGRSRDEVVNRVRSSLVTICPVHLVSESIGDHPSRPALIVVVDGWDKLNARDAIKECQVRFPFCPCLAVLTSWHPGHVAEILEAGASDCSPWVDAGTELLARARTRLGTAPQVLLLVLGSRYTVGDPTQRILIMKNTLIICLSVICATFVTPSANAQGAGAAPKNDDYTNWEKIDELVAIDAAYRVRLPRINNPKKCAKSDYYETVPGTSAAQIESMNKTLLSAFLAGRKVKLLVESDRCSSNERPAYYAVMLKDNQ